MQAPFMVQQTALEERETLYGANSVVTLCEFVCLEIQHPRYQGYERFWLVDQVPHDLILSRTTMQKLGYT